MNEIKLYEYNYDKMSLDDALIHFGVKGMHWGVRKDGKPQGYQGTGKGHKKSSSSKKPVTKKQKKAAREEEIKSKSKEDIIASKDLEAMSKRKSEFSTQEINDTLNRINAEQRLDQAFSQQNPTTKDKVKKVVNSKEFKIAAGVAVVALPIAIYAAKNARRSSNMVLGPTVSRSNIGNQPATLISNKTGARQLSKDRYNKNGLSKKGVYDNPYLKAYTTQSKVGKKIQTDVGGFVMYDKKYSVGKQPDIDKAANALSQLLFGVNLKKGK